MFSQVKLYAAGAGLLLVFGLFAALYVQTGRVEILQGEIKQLEASNAAAVKANKSNMLAMDELKAERDRMGKRCTSTTAEKDNTITKQQEIIAACTGGTNEIRTSDSALRTDSPDPVFALLDGMLPCSRDRNADGVPPRAGAPSAEGAPLPAGDVDYRLDRNNALRFSANVAMVCDWALGMAATLNSYQTGTK